MTDSQIDTIAKIAKKVSAENNRRHYQAHAIKELVQRRQKVLVALCDLGNDSIESDSKPILQDLKSFIQALVDYTALGHFEIYERIINGKERRQSVHKVASRVYPVISKTTEAIIGFNDKYDGIDDQENLSSLRQDLSNLSEVVATRIESEDQLIDEITAGLLCLQPVTTD